MKLFPAIVIVVGAFLALFQFMIRESGGSDSEIGKSLPITLTVRALDGVPEPASGSATRLVSWAFELTAHNEVGVLRLPKVRVHQRGAHWRTPEDVQRDVVRLRIEAEEEDFFLASSIPIEGSAVTVINEQIAEFDPGGVRAILAPGRSEVIRVDLTISIHTLMTTVSVSLMPGEENVRGVISQTRASSGAAVGPTIVVWR